MLNDIVIRYTINWYLTHAMFSMDSKHLWIHYSIVVNRKQTFRSQNEMHVNSKLTTSLNRDTPKTLKAFPTQYFFPSKEEISRVPQWAFQFRIVLLEKVFPGSIFELFLGGLAPSVPCLGFFFLCKTWYALFFCLSLSLCTGNHQELRAVGNVKEKRKNRIWRIKQTSTWITWIKSFESKNKSAIVDRDKVPKIFIF